MILRDRKPAVLALADHFNLVVCLLHLMLLGIGNDSTLFSITAISLWGSISAQDQRVIDVLGAQILQRLLYVGVRCHCAQPQNGSWSESTV